MAPFRTVFSLGIIIFTLVAFGYSNRGYMRAQVARNLAWIHILENITSASTSRESLSQSSEHIDLAISLNENQPRLSAISAWYDTYQTRTKDIRKNQIGRSLIQSTLQCYNVNIDDCEQEKQALLSLANQADDMEAWLALAYFSSVDPGEDSLNQSLSRLSDKSPEFPISNDFSYGNLKLEGYDWLPLSQERYSRNRIIVYWQSATNLPTRLNPGAGVYQWDKRIVQIYEAPNLIANGDFEWISLSDKSSLPYPWSLATLDLQRDPSVQIISDGRLIREAVAVKSADATSKTTYLQMQNEWERTFLSTLLHDLQVGSTYLLVGRVKAPQESKVQIMQNVSNVNQHPLIIYCGNASVLEACGGVFSLQDRGDVYLHLHLNGPRSTVAHYDDLGLFELEPPQIQE